MKSHPVAGFITPRTVGSIEDTTIVYKQLYIYIEYNSCLGVINQLLWGHIRTITCFSSPYTTWYLAHLHQITFDLRQMTLDEEVHGRCKQDHRTDGTEDLAAASSGSVQQISGMFLPSHGHWNMGKLYTILEDNDQRSNNIFLGNLFSDGSTLYVGGSGVLRPREEKQRLAAGLFHRNHFSRTLQGINILAN